MEFREKVLYHQIHPIKLLTDWGTGLAAAYLLWHHQLTAALLVGLVPPVVVSTLLLRWADLERYRASRFGRYVARYMTRATQLVRLAGLAFVWGGAWVRRPPWIAFGLAVIVAAWARGMLWPSSSLNSRGRSDAQ